MEEKNETLKIVKELFDRWNNWLETNSPETMASFYLDDYSFLPTLNGELKKWKKWAKEYFEHFLEKNPTWEIIEDTAEKISDDTYLHSWLYNFEVDWNWWREKVEARFTYIWKKLWNGHWKIIHHHSSVRPESNH